MARQSSQAESAAAPPQALQAGQSLAPDRRDGVRRALAHWFAAHQRELPWRRDYAPYGVWISEMMLQQTQVETVLPYYRRWMARFPDVRALAAAPLEDVLKLWEGLGYYARARNLHRAARAIVAEHGGQIPGTVEALRTLPGIGAYSAGAIASIAYEQPVPLVDGNVARVLSRLEALETPWRTPVAEAVLWRVAGELVAPGAAREINQALMELGALVCTRGEPHCLLCPLRDLCRARQTGDPAAYPRRQRRAAPRPVRGVVVVLRHGTCYGLHRRPARSLWGGLWEFPWVEREPGESAPAARARQRFAVSHSLTHMAMTLDGALLETDSAALPGDADGTSGAEPDGEAWAWVDAGGLARRPMSRMAQKVADQLGLPHGLSPREDGPENGATG
jgi:A/G-specific adenine glycosylase